MYHIKVYGTGSSGNCMLIETSGARILIDVGLPPSRIDDSLSTLDAIFLTHEHGDHNQFAASISSTYEIPVYGSQGTIDGTPGLLKRLTKVLESHKTYTVKGIYVVPFRVEHDAAEPFGYLFMNEFKEKLLFVSETGCLQKVKAKADIYIVEANYSRALIESDYDAGKINAKLYNRIFSPVGHTPVEDAIDFALRVPDNKVIFHHSSTERFGDLEIPDNVSIAKSGSTYRYGVEIPY